MLGIWMNCSSTLMANASIFGAVDQDGDVVDILVQIRRNKNAACRFFRMMLKRHGVPCKIVTDKLRR